MEEYESETDLTKIAFFGLPKFKIFWSYTPPNLQFGHQVPDPVTMTIMMTMIMMTMIVMVMMIR